MVTWLFDCDYPPVFCYLYWGMLMNILAVGAHADDVELGCGGSLLKWARQGHNITIYTATDSSYNSPDGKHIRSSTDAAREAAASADKIVAKLIIDSFKCFHLAFYEPLNAKLVEIIYEEKPDLILTHWQGDTHPDHQALAKATLHSSRQVPSVLMYMSNCYIGTGQFNSRFFVDISETLEEKIDLIALFKSENDRTGGNWLQSARDMAQVIGRQCGVSYAEGFEVVKWLE